MKLKNYESLLIPFLLLVGMLIIYVGSHGGQQAIFSSQPVQYYNEPVEIYLELGDGESVSAAKTTFNGEPVLVNFNVVGNIAVGEVLLGSEGYLVTELGAEQFVIQVKAPYISGFAEVPLNADKGVEKELFFKTYTPQGSSLNVSRVLLEYSTPRNEFKSVLMTQTGEGVYSYKVLFELAGNYYFTFTPQHPLFSAKPVSMETTVLGTKKVTFFWYFMATMIGLLLLLFIIKRLRK